MLTLMHLIHWFLHVFGDTMDQCHPADAKQMGIQMIVCGSITLKFKDLKPILHNALGLRLRSKTGFSENAGITGGKMKNVR